MPTWRSCVALAEPIICTDILSLVFSSVLPLDRQLAAYSVCSRNLKSQEEYKYLLPVM